MSILYRSMTRDAADLPVPTTERAPVSDADIAGLPSPARRYLRFMRVLGRPRDWSFRARFSGRFRMRPDQRWLRCTGWQYNSGLEIARVFHMRIDIAGLIPMYGHDIYRHGRGHMHGTLLGLIPLADGSGPAYDIGELVTYLNDAILLAPSMLLDLPASWNAIDNDSFEITLTDATNDTANTVSAVVTLDERGAPTTFTTTDRFRDVAGTPVRTRWSTPVVSWTNKNRRPHPAHASAVWHLTDEPFPYADFRFSTKEIRYNQPGSGPDTDRRARLGARPATNPTGSGARHGQRGDHLLASGDSADVPDNGGIRLEKGPGRR
jgi:hypothetical protein